METPPSTLYLGLRQEFLSALKELHHQGYIKECAADLAGLSSPHVGLVIVDFTPSRPLLHDEGTDEVAFDQQDAQAFVGLLRTLKLMTNQTVRGSRISDRTRWIFINVEENIFGHAIGSAFHVIPSQFYSHVSPGQLKPKRGRLLRAPRRLLSNLLDLLADKTRPLRLHPASVHQGRSAELRAPALVRFLNSSGVVRLYWSVVRLRWTLNDTVRVPRSLRMYGLTEQNLDFNAVTEVSERNSIVR